MGRLLARLVAAQDGWAKPLGDFNHRWLSALFRPDPADQGLPQRDLAGPPAPPGGDGPPDRRAPPDGHPRHRSASRRRPTSPSSRRSCSCWPPRSRAPPTTSTPRRTARTRATVHATLMVVGLVLLLLSIAHPGDRTDRPDDPHRAVDHRVPDRHGRGVRRRRRRVRLRQHGQPARLPRRRHQVDQARHRRRDRPRDAAGGDADQGEGRDQRPRAGPDRATVHALHAVCAHAGGPLPQGTVVDGCIECPVARRALPPDRRPRPPRPGGLRPARRTRSGPPRAAATRCGAPKPEPG